MPTPTMRLSCPNCQTEYDVPDAALTGRPRTLRCASCMTLWKVPALAMYRDEAETPGPAAPEPAAPELATPETVVAPETVATLEDPAEIVLPSTAPEPVVSGDETLEGEALRIEKAPPAPEPVRVSLLKTSREVPAEPAPEPPSGRGLRISVLLVLVIIVAVLAEHRSIGNLWPPSLRLFHALGLR